MPLCGQRRLNSGFLQRTEMLTDKYIKYIGSVRRYSPRTLDIYRDILDGFVGFCCAETSQAPDDAALKAWLEEGMARSYEVSLLQKQLSSKTVNQHLSVLSSFCRYLVKNGELESNPISNLSRPKVPKRLPEYYREDLMKEYFKSTKYLVDEADTFGEKWYLPLLRRTIMSILYNTGIRRSELISLTISSFDNSRRTLSVIGKGDKMREIPLISSLCEEIIVYLHSAETMAKGERAPSDPLLINSKGGPLNAEFVDRSVKQELGLAGVTGRKSPHALRHSLATGLLDEGADLNSIKELLGHSSLAATQVYTHNSIAKLKNVYMNAHPRAKKGGNNGD